MLGAGYDSGAIGADGLLLVERGLGFRRVAGDIKLRRITPWRIVSTTENARERDLGCAATGKSGRIGVD